MNSLNSNLAEEQSLHVFAEPGEAPHELTVEEARIALEAVQRMNAKLELENADLRERIELLDQLVVKLLKQNDRLSNRD